MTKTLTHSFFDGPAPKVARDLIGCLLVRRRSGKTERFIITETEAYDGFSDKASHASRGMTARNEIMFRSAGHIYVYFTYGMHWMLNIVTGPKGYPAAILIRGLRNVDGKTNLNGPAKLTKALDIDGEMNGLMLGRKAGLWIKASTIPLRRPKIKTSPRIGVDYAGPVWSKKKWRFILEP